MKGNEMDTVIALPSTVKLNLTLNLPIELLNDPDALGRFVQKAGLEAMFNQARVTGAPGSDQNPETD